MPPPGFFCQCFTRFKLVHVTDLIDVIGSNAHELSINFLIVFSIQRSKKVVLHVLPIFCCVSDQKGRPKYGSTEDLRM